MRRSVSILSTAGAVLSAATPLFADAIRSASVMASASDFATPERRVALDKRIELAAEEVCGANAVAEGVSWGSIKDCRVQVREDIYRKLAALNPSSDLRLSAR